MVALNLKSQTDSILSLDKIDLIGSDRRLTDDLNLEDQWQWEQ